MGDRDVLSTARRGGAAVPESARIPNVGKASRRTGVAWDLAGECTPTAQARGDRMATPGAPHQNFIAAPHRGASPSSDPVGRITRGTPTVSLVAIGQHLRPGQPTSLVAVISGPAGAASGTVTFDDNGTPVHRALLNGGVAIFTTSKLHGGVNVFTVAYGGDGNYQAAASTGVDVVVVTHKRMHGGQNYGRLARLAVSHGQSRGERGPRLEGHA